MSNARIFPAEDIISAATGVLVPSDGTIGPVYEVCSHMMGVPVYTHQLPRVCREINGEVLRQHPNLAAAFKETKQVSRDNWQTFRTLWRDRYGMLPLVPMPNVTPVDPIAELVDMVGEDRVIVVKP